MGSRAHEVRLCSSCVLPKPSLGLACRHHHPNRHGPATQLGGSNTTTTVHGAVPSPPCPPHPHPPTHIHAHDPHPLHNSPPQPSGPPLACRKPLCSCLRRTCRGSAPRQGQHTGSSVLYSSSRSRGCKGRKAVGCYFRWCVACRLGDKMASCIQRGQLPRGHRTCGRCGRSGGGSAQPFPGRTRLPNWPGHNCHGQLHRAAATFRQVHLLLTVAHAPRHSSLMSGTSVCIAL